MLDLLKGLGGLACSAFLLFVLYLGLSFDTPAQSKAWIASWNATSYVCRLFGLVDNNYCVGDEAHFICPWADGIVQLRFSSDQRRVRLEYNLYERLPLLTVDEVPHPFIASQTVLHFWDVGSAYVYEFWFYPEATSLLNSRFNVMTGAKMDQHSYCLAMTT